MAKGSVYRSKTDSTQDSGNVSCCYLCWMPYTVEQVVGSQVCLDHIGYYSVYYHC